MTDITHSTKVTIRRVIKAPRERVFDAWTQPEHLKHWFRAKPGWSTPIANVDLRVGGEYRLGMLDPQAEQPDVCFGYFKEVCKPEKLVYTWSWEPPETDIGETLVTVVFLEQGDATEIRLTHERFPNPEVTSRHAEGWSGCIDAFVAHIET